MAAISYIITTYNRPQSLLNQAMQSILSERLSGESELIVVDDCSNEPAIVSAFDGQARLIRNAQNQGVIKSRNIGLMAAQHEYVLFLDDDDVAYANRSRDLLAVIEGTSHAFVAGRIRLFDDTDQYRLVPAQYDLPLSPFRYLCNLAHINAVMWRRRALLEINGFDNRVPYFGEHITMLLLLLRGNTAGQIGAIVAQFQPITGGLTLVSRHHNLIKQYFIELFRILLDEPLPADFRQVCAEAQLFLRQRTCVSVDEMLDYLKNLP